MTGSYREAWEERRQKNLASFSSPEYELFELRFGCNLPKLLRSHFSLNELLMNAPLVLPLDGIKQLVRGFYPLSKEVIEGSKQYDWKFIRFMSDSEGETLLAPIGNSNTNLFVDHNDAGSDIEETSLLLEEVVEVAALLLTGPS
ncbi:hypothetical protein OAG68_00290 [bacterium]|nr:hypothetical protein [bacterium]